MKSHKDSNLRISVMGKHPSNVVLIGMPGSGKSSIGILLANLTSSRFIDTDTIIQSSQGTTLQEIVDRYGYLALRAIEEKVILGLNCSNHVIATGGSAVYSHAAMSHLRSHGIVVFLQVEIYTLKGRIYNYDSRGLAKHPDQTFEDLFMERSSLYLQHADVTIICDGLNHEQVCAKIIQNLKMRNWVNGA